MIYIGLFVFYAYLLWLLFIVVMSLKAKWRDLPLDVKIASVPAVFAALVMDVAFNFTIANILFLKLPTVREWGITVHVTPTMRLCVPFVPIGVEWTFSQRLGEYKKRVDWREPIARRICSRLDLFEVGGHCK